jgi:hypothetical protein
MLSQSRHFGSIAAAEPDVSGHVLEAAIIAVLLVLVGLVWLIIGAAVMRGARVSSAPRRLLQRGLADVQAIAAG